MARRKYTIKPVGMAGVTAEWSDSITPSQFMIFDWSNAFSKNISVRRGAARLRPGITSDRTGVGTKIYGIADFTTKAGVTSNLFLTDTDLCKRETSGSNTFSYRTDTYTTGTIDSIAADTPSAGKSTVTGDGTDFVTAAIAAGDKFIMNDDHSQYIEPDTDWATVESVTDATHLVLSSNYTKNGTEYRLRRIFTAPTAPVYWSFCTVGDKFCFTNVNEHVWYWSGANYAAALDSTNATTFKFCIEFADRLVLANKAAYPTLIKWCKNLDPTDWTDSTAGEAELLTSGDAITGLGKVGSYLVVYTNKSIVFGYKTGIPTAPIGFLPEKPGVGCWSAPSIVNADGTNFFAGRDNFYKLEGMQAVPIGNAIAREVFDNIAIADLPIMVGVHNSKQNEIIWRENTGGRMFVYNYRDKTWTHWKHASAVGTSMGTWTLSSDEEVVVHSDGKLGYFAEGTKNDFSDVITYYLVTPRMDFSDQDPEAEAYDKTLYTIRLWYRDLVSSTTMNLLYKKNDDANFSTWDQEVVGDGDGTLKFIDMENVDTGYSFQFAISVGAASKDVQVEKLEVFYELAGPSFN